MVVHYDSGIGVQQLADRNTNERGSGEGAIATGRRVRPGRSSVIPRAVECEDGGVEWTGCVGYQSVSYKI